MGVVATFIRTEPVSVQHGATIAENAIDSTIGKVCVVKYLQEEGQIKAGAEKITTQWCMKLENLL